MSAIFHQLVDPEDVAGVELAVTPPRYARNQVEMPDLWPERKRPRRAVTQLSLPLRPCRSRWTSSAGFAGGVAEEVCHRN